MAGNDGFFNGLESGMKLGLLAREIRNKEREAQIEQQKNEQMGRHAAAQEKLERFDKLVLGPFEKLAAINPGYVQQLWPQMREGVKQNFGLDMGELSDAKIGSMKRIRELIELTRKPADKGGMSWEAVTPLISMETTEMTKPQTDQVKDILGLDIGYQRALHQAQDTKKDMTPEDAAKRWSEITTTVTKMSKLGEMQSAAVAINPSLAENKDFMKAISYNPDEINQMQGAFLNEMRVIAPHLPPDQRPRFFTRAQYKLAKEEYQKRLKRPVSDAEMYSRVIPID